MKNIFLQIIIFVFFCFGDNPLFIYSMPLIIFLTVLFEKTHNNNILKYFILFFIFLTFGITTALINLNKLNYIINNSAGFFTLLFILSYNKYFNLIFNEKFLKIIAITIFLQILTALFLELFANFNTYNNDNFFVLTLLGDFKGGSSTGHFRLFSLKIIIAIYFFIILFVVNLSKRYFFQSTLYLICSFILVILMASKGLITGYLFLLFIFFISIKKTIKISLVFLIIFLLFLYLSIQFNLFLLISATFDKDDISNSIRLQQTNYLLKDGLPFGKGFGALIKSESFRSESSPYGYELSYYSYFHKLGLIILFFILYPAYIFIKNLKFILFKEISLIDFSIVLFSFLYIMPSIGNPVLFHPFHTFLFVIPIIMYNKVLSANTNVITCMHYKF